ncbi:MAG: Crp/Fnr family transcriptional regulator [Deltaproteobacteria bacterium]|nr:MAG: Crp/Fnr family transcriptional regulator [Deltaproteobacteria bacterium]
MTFSHTAPESETDETTRKLLFKLPLFNSFDVEELNTLARHMSYIQIDSGECIFKEGDRGNFMGFVVNGVLEVMKKSENGQNITIARITKGFSIGEMSLLDKSPRSATVVAIRPSLMVTLTNKGLDLLTQKHPALGVKLLHKIIRLMGFNMRRTSSRLADLTRDCNQ